MKSRYYEAELAYLREQGREFARVFPTTAGLLAERSDDPDVERLLEGFAFLVSRIRERVDDGMPELAQQLAAVLIPQLTRPIPPATIIQFSPDTRGLRSALSIARGAQVAGQLPSQGRCLFQTTHHTEILPLALDDVRHERPTSRTDKIILEMRAPEHALQEIGKKSIRLHMHGEIAFSATLRLWFLQHCTEIAIVADGSVKSRVREAPTSVGLDRASRLLPDKPLEHDSFTTLAELFAFPQKFAFVDLPPLGNPQRPQFEIHATFERPPKLPKNPVKGDIRLHCAPIVNLFSTTSDPVRFKPLRPEAVIRVAEHDPVRAEVWDVTKVVGSKAGSRRTYPAFSEFRATEDKDPRYYRLRRVPSATDVGTDVFISLMSPRDVHPVAEPEVLSIDVLATNRAAATQLKVGELSTPVRGPAATTRFTNIEPISPPLYPHDNVELLWRLSAHLGLSRRGLQDADTLRRVLEVYNFGEHGNPGLGRLNTLWVDSIREVQTRKLVRLFRGAPITGTRCIVLLDETNFGATGEALLFGEVLNEVFARRVSVNSFNALTIQLVPSRREYKWPPRNGNLTL